MTHRLDPYKPIESRRQAHHHRGRVPGLEMAVHLSGPQYRGRQSSSFFPPGFRLNFRITSDTVMTSFFIPQLGSQIYAMAGMQSQLHLMADEPGTYPRPEPAVQRRRLLRHALQGDCRFRRKQFEAWVQKTQTSPDKLDLARI